MSEIRRAIAGVGAGVRDGGWHRGRKTDNLTSRFITICKLKEVHVNEGMCVCAVQIISGLDDQTKGLFTWREGSPANRATRLTELLGEG